MTAVGTLLSVESQPRHLVEQCVCRQQWRLDVDGRCCDPEVVGVDGFVQGVPASRQAWRSSATVVSRASLTARRWSLRSTVQALPTLIAPAGDEGAIAKLGDSDCGKEDRWPAISATWGSKRTRRRRLMDARKTPVSTRIR